MEFAAADSSAALKAGAVEQLICLLNENSEKSLEMFEKMVRAAPALLSTHYALDFI